ncbi:putative methionine--tRNA ligase isoform X1 [Prunus yedoensis var. nudiflora]|uniref:methionine--tRNA ligase n=1 Tax=Prunus yedoensis var. nudiflora TaxID=2094558 RepID=A0A314YLL1_PRUYE|nr:putative methionine--tRNA ligase isoform X1 [Prunus yedoensis var. nudiflora]
MRKGKKKKTRKPPTPPLLSLSALYQFRSNSTVVGRYELFFDDDANACHCTRELDMGDLTVTSKEDQKAPKLPIPGKRNVLITSALPYVNNVPHLGNIIGCVLSADVFARYCRLRGYNTVYICGTDEYGTATETKAMEEKCSPQEICDKYHAIHREVYEWFNISFEKFGRTSTPQQTEVCQEIFKKLLENGWLSENTMQQLYCDTCKRFLADRLVEGTCPTQGCDYGSARGDQCENCGKLLNPTELKDPKCKVCKTTPRIRDTNHLFLELPLLKDKLEEYIDRTSVAGSWSQNAIQATNAWLKEGLKQRCITRDLKWGVPVPHDNFKDKVFYVWFDAPIGYVSITKCYTDDWEQWWKNPKNVELYQFMGKDNVPFHTVMFPSTLLGTGENWTLMKTISVTEYLNYEAGKFSKSKGIGVFGNDAKDTNIPVEVWRYYLLTNRPEVSDTLFTWADLQAKLNSELLNNLGNFINRVLSFVAKPSGQGYGSIIPDAPSAESDPLTEKLAEKVGKYVEQYIESMEKVKLKQGLKTAMSISSEGNAYLQESQFWKLYKEDQPRCAVVMRTSVGLVHLLACLLEPFMPSFSLEVFKQLDLPPETHISLYDDKGDIARARRPWEIVPIGHKIGKPEPLFKELKDEEVESLRKKFAGSQADRKEREEAEAVKVAAQLKKMKVSDNSGKKKQQATKSAAEAEISISRLDIRVGLITKAQKHPDADSLYVEEIDVGEGQTRTVVSGLVKYIPIEEMQNRKVCVLCNLKPATMRGIKSQAMVLAASNSDHTTVELVDPPKAAQVGERVTFPGFVGEPDELLNPKKKVWETLQVDLHTNTDLVACYRDIPLTTSAGVCTVSSIRGGSIR